MTECKEHNFKAIYYRGTLKNKPAWIKAKDILICDKCLEIRRLKKSGS